MTDSLVRCQRRRPMAVVDRNMTRVRHLNVHGTHLSDSVMGAPAVILSGVNGDELLRQLVRPHSYAYAVAEVPAPAVAGPDTTLTTDFAN